MRLPKNTAHKSGVPLVLACGLGPGAALTAHRAVIHYRAAAFGFAGFMHSRAERVFRPNRIRAKKIAQSPRFARIFPFPRVPVNVR